MSQGEICFDFYKGIVVLIFVGGVVYVLIDFSIHRNSDFEKCLIKFLID